MSFENQARLLRGIRAKLGISQVEMARSICVTPQFISNAERGKVALAPRKWKHLRNVLPRDIAMSAYVQDLIETFEEKYGK